ncbi:MAG: cyclodeaminase/cyclohydrolase family protein, partial [Pseudomonadota bacterium]|nr:cyclodeaminase/cyclohydrolase family protein [Pseudomonadota bacterium]
MSAEGIAEYSVERFLETLASAAPTPGGGSAAAVMGAAGAALISMVCNVSTGKKACAAAEADLAAIAREAEALRARLTAMIAQDVAAFAGLMASYK